MSRGGGGCERGTSGGVKLRGRGGGSLSARGSRDDGIGEIAGGGTDLALGDSRPGISSGARGRGAGGRRGVGGREEMRGVGGTESPRAGGRDAGGAEGGGRDARTSSPEVDASKPRSPMSS